MREVTYEVEMSSEARDFLLKNSPNAKFIMDLPKVVSSEWYIIPYLSCMAGFYVVLAEFSRTCSTTIATTVIFGSP